MTPTLLFVHGTGVREARYAATLAVIQQRVAALELDLDVAGCFWGQAAGAALRADGASIPTYDETGGAALSAEEELLALWTLLYTDPWYELRLLRQLPSPEPIAPHERPASVRLREAVDAYVPSAATRAALDEQDLVDLFDQAIVALRRAPELDEAAATAFGAAQEHRRAIARALVAHALVAAEEQERTVVDGTARDTLVTAVSDDLHGHGLGVGSLLTRPLKGVATWRAKRRRGAINDGAAPLAGDVLRFLARGDGARDYLRQEIARCARRGPVHLLGHSLGGIMCVDLLVRGRLDGVAGLISVGSQAPFLYEIGALPGLDHPHSLPAHFPRWTNIYDRRDLLSYIGAGVFAGRVTDVEVDNRQPFPEAHSAYWTNAKVWAEIAKAVA